LRATRRRLGKELDAALGRAAEGSQAVLAELEEALLAADVGVRMTTELVACVRDRIGHAQAATLKCALRAEVEAVLTADAGPRITASPWIVLVTGVNGVGKTTTIGKLAAAHGAAGRRVLLIAADTFRAAAIDQLAVWAGRVGAELVHQSAGADPSAVVFDGVKAALSRKTDVVLVDTAGRLHTRANLMEEIRKIRRVIGREVPGAPHETLLVLDATTGQNAVAQARAFTEAVGVTGIVMTKLDGTARGGVLIAVRRETGVPVRYIGIGEAVEDLRPFDARQFAEALFGVEGDEGAAASESP
jgi:fused signal recognition particle receptor